MRLVTMKQWDAFTALTNEIHEAMAQMGPIAQGLAVLVANSDPTDPAQVSIPINAMRAGAEMKKRAEELLERFEVMAKICTGERRQAGESLMEFFERSQQWMRSQSLARCRGTVCVWLGVGDWRIGYVVARARATIRRAALGSANAKTATSISAIQSKPNHFPQLPGFRTFCLFFCGDLGLFKNIVSRDVPFVVVLGRGKVIGDSIV